MAIENQTRGGYPALMQKNILGIPASVEVSTMDTGEIIRKRTTDNIDTNTGAIGRIIAHYTEDDEDKEAITDMTYNSYGSLTSVTYPENQNGDRVSLNYQYDNVVNTYVTKVQDNLGYNSETEYDFKTGNILKAIDTNQNQVLYKYDDFNRLIQVNGPKEPNQNTQYTLKFEYHPTMISTDTYPYAVSKHFDSQHPDNPLETITFTDGFGSAIQVKKDIDLQELGNLNSNESMLISGRVVTDSYGRAIMEFQPLSEPKNNDLNKKLFKTLNEFKHPTTTQYDEFDRVVEVNLPVAEHTSNMEYGIDTDGFGKKQLKTKTTVKQSGDHDLITETFTDVNGRTTSVKNLNDGDEIWTKYKYDEIGQVKEIIDNEGFSILSTYDQLGRRVEMTHPDAGTNRYWYDPIGNLVKMQTPNLLNYHVGEDDKFIKYHYDELNRLIEIKHPPIHNGGNLNDVYYVYGSATETAANAKGKLIAQRDGTGKQEFSYGKMGELTKSTRWIVAPNLPDRKFVHKYEYDSHNRLLNLLHYKVIH